MNPTDPKPTQRTDLETVREMLSGSHCCNPDCHECAGGALARIEARLSTSPEGVMAVNFYDLDPGSPIDDQRASMYEHPKGGWVRREDYEALAALASPVPPEGVKPVARLEQPKPMPGQVWKYDDGRDSEPMLIHAIGLAGEKVTWHGQTETLKSDSAWVEHGWKWNGENKPFPNLWAERPLASFGKPNGFIFLAESVEAYKALLAHPAPVQEGAARERSEAEQALEWMAAYYRDNLGGTEEDWTIADFEGKIEDMRERLALASRPVPEAVGLPEGCPETVAWDPYWGLMQVGQAPNAAPVEIHPVGTRARMASLAKELDDRSDALLREQENNEGLLLRLERTSHPSPQAGADVCECDKCGANHYALQAGTPPFGLAREDFQYLSRVFNAGAQIGSISSPGYKINEWLKARIAAAAPTESKAGGEG